MNPYVFNKSTNVGVQSIIHTINITQGENLIGIEVGVGSAISLCTLAQRIDNLQLIYGIDPYLEYVDFLKDRYDGTPAVIHDDKEMDFCRTTAEHNIKYSGVSDKIKLIKDKSNNIFDSFDNESVDFIYIDCYNTTEEMYEEMTRWYPKIKTGGVFSGHDVYYQACYDTVVNFRNNNNIKNKMSVFDDVFVWIK
jgi:hypothetical protein